MTVQLTRPRRGASGPAASTRFVGRMDELEGLGRVLSAAVAGTGGAAFVTGEPGIGKTRLLQEFSLRAQGAGARVLWGRCCEGEGGSAYAPWVQALSTCLDEMTPQWFQAAIGSSAAALGQLVPALPTPFACPMPPALGPAEERLRLHDAVTQLLLTIARDQPLVLILDDLHWADRSSLALLEHLGHSLAASRILAVGAYREMEIAEDSPLPTVLGRLRREPGYTRIPLHGLLVEETRAFLSDRSELPVAPDLALAIAAESHGNPFFIGEIVRHLAEVGLLTGGDSGAWGIPEGVRQVVAARVARLSQATQSVLRLIAGFSQGVEFPVLQALSGLPEPALLDCLDEALRAQVLGAAEGQGERYEFVHAIVRHAIADTLSPGRRLRLHRQIAGVLEEVYAGREAEHAAELAVQYAASAALPGAEGGVRHALIAAWAAKAVSAHEQTVRFLRIARMLAPAGDASLRAPILRDLAIAEAEALLLDDAYASATAALVAMEATGESAEAIGDLLVEVTRALGENGARGELWKPLAEYGLTLTGDVRGLTWARLMRVLAYHDAITEIQPADDTLRRWESVRADVLHILRSRGEAEDYAGTLDMREWTPRSEIDAVLPLARRWRQPRARLDALGCAANALLYWHGAFAEARDLCRELSAEGERYGAILCQANALLWLSRAEAALGDFCAAEQAAQQCSALIARLGPDHILRSLAPWLAATLDHYCEHVGEWPARAAMWRHAAADRSAALRPFARFAQAQEAFAQLRAGNSDEALRLLEVLTQRLEEPPSRRYLDNGAVAIAAGVVWELAATPFAARYRALALALLDAGIGDHPLGSHELTIARMAALLGEWSEAEPAFARARAASAASGRCPLRAVVDYDEALALIRLHSRDAARIAALLGAALDAFQELGMGGWAERALAQQHASRRLHRRAPSHHPDGLTEREIAVLRLIAAGRSNRQIAADLVLSLRTAERHVANLYAKIHARNRAEATAYFLRHEA